MNESVSVVITCYNLEQYIHEAVRSVLAQDSSGDVQIVVVDDCSTDRSRSILEATSGIELVFRELNGGVMNAMISGLRSAKHDVVFFLDGDDSWHASKLTECMATFGGDVKLCTHDLWYMDSNARPISRESRVSEKLSPTPAEDRGEIIGRAILRHDDYVWLGSAFGVRRSSAKVEDFISFCESQSYLDTCYQDWPLAVWAALVRGGRMTYVDRKLFGYRLHASNYSGSAQTLEKMGRNLRKSLDTMRLIEAMMDHHGAIAGDRAAARHVRMHYELLLASTQDSRWTLVRTALRNREGLKAIVKSGLCLCLGEKNAHGIIEYAKRSNTR